MLHSYVIVLFHQECAEVIKLRQTSVVGVWAFYCICVVRVFQCYVRISA